MTSRTTIVSPIRLTRIMKKKSASISGAIFEASGGKSGKLVIHLTRNCHKTGLMWLIRLSVHLCSLICLWRVGLPGIPAKHDQHESAHQYACQEPAQLHRAPHDQRMFGGQGMVVVEESKNFTPRGADTIVRSLRQ